MIPALQREPHKEFHFPTGAQDLNGSVMAAGDCLCDSQPQPVMTVAGPGFVAAVKPVKQMLLLLRRDLLPVVYNGKDRVIFSFRSRRTTAFPFALWRIALSIKIEASCLS